MNALTGMEKFSHLEDKIYLIVELAKKLREENERLVGETEGLKKAAADAIAEKAAMEEKLDLFMAERDTIRLKVEAMLDAIMTVEPDIAEAVGR